MATIWEQVGNKWHAVNNMLKGYGLTTVNYSEIKRQYYSTCNTIDDLDFMMEAGGVIEEERKKIIKSIKAAIAWNGAGNMPTPGNPSGGTRPRQSPPAPQAEPPGPAKKINNNYTGVPSIKITEKQQGNNRFSLTLIINGENKVVLTGVLREMPEIGWSTEWENGPGATIADILTKKIDSDIINTMNFALGNADKSITFVNSDYYTSKCYKQSSPVEISLNFRVYTNNEFNSCTTAEDWISNLLMSSPSNSSNPNLSDAVTNLRNLFQSMTLDNFKDMFKISSITAGIGETNENLPIVHGKYKNELGDEVTFGFETAVNKSLKDRIKTDGKFGAKLYELRLYTNWLYNTNKPLIVYIKNWEYTPSKEEYNGKPFYYDFKITCSSDQILSAPSWNKTIKSKKGYIVKPT